MGKLHVSRRVVPSNEQIDPGLLKVRVIKDRRQVLWPPLSQLLCYYQPPPTFKVLLGSELTQQSNMHLCVYPCSYSTAFTRIHPRMFKDTLFSLSDECVACVCVPKVLCPTITTGCFRTTVGCFWAGIELNGLNVLVFTAEHKHKPNWHSSSHRWANSSWLYIHLRLHLSNHRMVERFLSLKQSGNERERLLVLMHGFVIPNREEENGWLLISAKRLGLTNDAVQPNSCSPSFSQVEGINKETHLSDEDNRWVGGRFAVMERYPSSHCPGPLYRQLHRHWRP